MCNCAILHSTDEDSEFPRLLSSVKTNAAKLLVLLIGGQSAAANSLRIVAGPGIVTAVLAAIFFCNPRNERHVKLIFLINNGVFYCSV